MQLAIMSVSSNMEVGAVQKRHMETTFVFLKVTESSCDEAQYVRKKSATDLPDSKALPIYGRRYSFAVYIGHKPLVKTLNAKWGCNTPKKIRQLKFISQFIQGNVNEVADS